MVYITEREIEWMLWHGTLSDTNANRAEGVARVMRMIRGSFIPKAEVAATIEKLRIPDAVETPGAEACEQIVFGYNKALDTVRVSLVSDSEKI